MRGISLSLVALACCSAFTLPAFADSCVVSSSPASNEVCTVSVDLGNFDPVFPGTIDFNFPQFDPRIGHLDSVGFLVDSPLTGHISYGTGDIEAFISYDPTIDLDSRVGGISTFIDADEPGGSGAIFIDALPNTSGDVPFTAHFPAGSFGTESFADLPPAVLDAFTGTGQIPFFLMDGLGLVIGNPECRCGAAPIITQDPAFQVGIQYNFTPATAVPEPSFFLAAAVLFGLVVIRAFAVSRRQI